MARIRSIHPGFFTDERLVATSMAARMLFLGLGVEADDKGVFEWKPVTLKMRIFPADSLDVEALLEELVQAGAIASYEIDGRRYGAIRNFRKHQRPKTPNDVYPITPEIRNYVGLPADDSPTPPPKSEPIPPKGETGVAEEGQFPQKGENDLQMEDGGWREGGKGEKPNGFSGRASAQKPNGFVHIRKTTDAINDVIQEIRDDAERTGIGSEGDWCDVPMLPAVGSR